jgi:hypothetical protein
VPVLAENRELQTKLSKEQEDEIQQTPRGPGSSMSGAPAAGHEPGIDSTERFPAALGTHCPGRLLPLVTALGGAGVARRTGRT